MNLMQRRRELLMMGGGGYIKNGLVLQLDGIDKGTSDTTKWVDLIGGIEFTEVNGVSMHNGNHLTFFGPRYGEQMLVGDKVVDFPASTHTVEAVMICRTGGWQGIFGSGKNGNVMLYKRNGNGGLAMAGTQIGVTEKLPLDIPIIVSLISERYMYNGEVFEYPSSNALGRNFVYPTIGSLENSVSQSYGFLGDLFAIRIYNRHLTTEEMLHNQKVDNERFNLGLQI